jgi:hypothetical protein
VFEAVDYPELFDLEWHPVPGRFYCPCCISHTKPGAKGGFGPTPTGWANRGEVRQHLTNLHGWDAATVQDALSHEQLVHALIKWRESHEEMIVGFEAAMLLVRDLDDFISECEDAA